MQKIKILSKKEIKNIKKKLDEQWGFSDDLNFTFLISNKGRINIVNQEVFDIDDTKLRIDSLGLYFATLIHNELRLSIEGSQIVGPKATKNVFEITDDELKQWIKGNDINKENPDTCFQIVKNNKNFFGCGRIKNNNLLNYFPKSRRIN
jgi:NOL1/NOP2/fmu family ribosome biogenesis protein